MSDLPSSQPVATQVFENNLIRSEVLGYLSDPLDLLNFGLVCKAAFRPAIRLLWKNATLGGVNLLYVVLCDRVSKNVDMCFILLS
jgi:hypothetical protein